MLKNGLHDVDMLSEKCFDCLLSGNVLSYVDNCIRFDCECALQRNCEDRESVFLENCENRDEHLLSKKSKLHFLSSEKKCLSNKIRFERNKMPVKNSIA